MKNDLSGKVVVITGASSGIGEAAAKLFAENGAKVVIGARRKEKLEKITEYIRSKGQTADYEITDVTNRSDVEKLVGKGLALYGKIDIIINNAGFMPLSRIDKFKVDEWESMIDINVKGVLYGIASALPQMQKQGFGHIINLSSLSGHTADPTAAVYSGTKFAVWAISDGLRKELAGTKIRTTIICPGFTDTEFGRDVSDENVEQLLKKYREKFMPPQAVANAILYAAEQPESVNVTEIVIRPTGL